MTIDYSLLVSSKVLQQNFVDKSTGEPLSAGVISLYRNDSRTLFKNWYYQSNDLSVPFLPLANPLTLSASGTIVDPDGNIIIPFYYPFSEDDNITPQSYYITIYNANGQLQETIENFPYNGQSNGNVTTGNLENIIINSRFWRNNGNTTPTATNENVNLLTNETNIVLAPSAHDGFHEPDFRFIKSAVGDTETMTFAKFALSDSGLPSGALTPEFYINHNCTSVTGTTSLKYYQFPLSLHLRTLEDYQVSFSFYAKNNTGNPTTNITIYFAKFLGTDASGGVWEQGSPVATFSIVPNWNAYKIEAVRMPTASADTISNTGDDAFYIWIALDPHVILDVDFCLPSLVIGPQAVSDFQSYDQIDAIIDTNRTGDFRTSLNSFQSFGWVAANDGTIGNALSNATTRSNIDTWPLYNLLWTNFPQAITPISGGRGASAYADWNANHPIALTKNLGRVLMGANPIFETPVNFTVTITPLPFTADAGTDTLTVTSTAAFVTGDALQVSTTGSLPSPLVIDTTYYAIVINATTLKLAETQADALNAVAINLTTTGSDSSIVNTTNELTLATPTRLSVGTPVYLSTDGDLPSLNPNQAYYISSPVLNGEGLATSVKVSSFLLDAEKGFYDPIVTAGSGTFTMNTATGAFVGYSYSTDVTRHRHTFSATHEYFQYNPGGGAPNLGGPTEPYVFSVPSGDTGYTGVEKFSLIQPSTFVNVFLKL